MLGYDSISETEEIRVCPYISRYDHAIESPSFRLTWVNYVIALSEVIPLKFNLCGADYVL